MSQQLLQYGSQLNPQEIGRTLDRIFQRNLEIGRSGRPTPVCIWGTHGLGKTQLVESYAKSRDWKFAYCAPAQFEEMGDLHGMPTVIDPDKDVTGDEYTVYAPPDWVPTQEGPGILLLDDVNRADDRILRGIMQLLQNFEMFSWQLPAQWQIVATANPEGGDYSVTPMDDAMLTRMLHLTMIFDAKAWAYWATRAKVDPRGIAFVLNYPETVTGQRTTPRTLTQFFGQTAGIADLQADAEHVAILAKSSLDDTTVGAFLSFVSDELTELVNPEEILEAKTFTPVKKRLKQQAKTKQGASRVDRLAAICTRLFLHLTKEDYKPSKNHKDNLVSFLTEDIIPNDLRMAMVMDIQKYGAEKTVEMLRDKRLAFLLIDSI
ncbi:AAA family ATPase [bacterium]|nr:AAA family ATPase [bacterium]